VIRLGEGDAIAGVETSGKGNEVLVVTKRGYGKRTPLTEYTLRARGGKGIRAVRLSEKSGLVAGVCLVGDSSDVVIASAKGVVIRLSAAHVPRMSRNTRGSRLIGLGTDDRVASVAALEDGQQGDARGRSDAVGQKPAGSSSEPI